MSDQRYLQRQSAAVVPGALGPLVEDAAYTPTYYGATTPGVTTYTTQAGYYQRVGNCVFFSAFVVWTAATGTGEARVSLPFTPATYFCALAVRSYDVTFAGASPQALVIPGTAAAVFEYPVTNAASVRINVEAAGQLLVSGVFFI